MSSNFNFPMPSGGANNGGNSVQPSGQVQIPSLFSSVSALLAAAVGGSNPRAFMLPAAADHGKVPWATMYNKPFPRPVKVVLTDEAKDPLTIKGVSDPIGELVKYKNKFTGLELPPDLQISMAFDVAGVSPILPAETVATFGRDWTIDKGIYTFRNGLECLTNKVSLYPAAAANANKVVDRAVIAATDAINAMFPLPDTQRKVQLGSAGRANVTRLAEMTYDCYRFIWRLGVLWCAKALAERMHTTVHTSAPTSEATLMVLTTATDWVNMLATARGGSNYAVIEIETMMSTTVDEVASVMTLAAMPTPSLRFGTVVDMPGILDAWPEIVDLRVLLVTEFQRPAIDRYNSMSAAMVWDIAQTYCTQNASVEVLLECIRNISTLIMRPAKEPDGFIGFGECSLAIPPAKMESCILLPIGQQSLTFGNRADMVDPPMIKQLVYDGIMSNMLIQLGYRQAMFARGCGNPYVRQLPICQAILRGMVSKNRPTAMMGAAQEILTQVGVTLSIGRILVTAQPTAGWIHAEVWKWYDSVHALQWKEATMALEKMPSNASLFAWVEPLAVADQSTIGTQHWYKVGTLPEARSEYDALHSLYIHSKAKVVFAVQVSQPQAQRVVWQTMSLGTTSEGHLSDWCVIGEMHVQDLELAPVFAFPALSDVRSTVASVAFHKTLRWSVEMCSDRPAVAIRPPAVANVYGGFGNDGSRPPGGGGATGPGGMDGGGPPPHGDSPFGGGPDPPGGSGRGLKAQSDGPEPEMGAAQLIGVMKAPLRETKPARADDAASRTSSLAPVRVEKHGDRIIEPRTPGAKENWFKYPHGDVTQAERPAHQQAKLRAAACRMSGINALSKAAVAPGQSEYNVQFCELLIKVGAAIERSDTPNQEMTPDAIAKLSSLFRQIDPPKLLAAVEPNQRAQVATSMARVIDALAIEGRLVSQVDELVRWSSRFENLAAVMRESPVLTLHELQGQLEDYNRVIGLDKLPNNVKSTFKVLKGLPENVVDQIITAAVRGQLDLQRMFNGLVPSKKSDTANPQRVVQRVEELIRKSISDATRKEDAKVLTEEEETLEMMCSVIEGDTEYESTPLQQMDMLVMLVGDLALRDNAIKALTLYAQAYGADDSRRAGFDEFKAALAGGTVQKLMEKRMAQGEDGGVDYGQEQVEPNPNTDVCDRETDAMIGIRDSGGNIDGGGEPTVKEAMLEGARVLSAGMPVIENVLPGQPDFGGDGLADGSSPPSMSQLSPTMVSESELGDGMQSSLPVVLPLTGEPARSVAFTTAAAGLMEEVE
jgi:hypothetical protein